jgi:hypothetical protein
MTEVTLTPAEETPPPLSQIDGIESYFRWHGHDLGRKANTMLSPLHTPMETPLDDMEKFPRKPFELQAHAITAARLMLDHARNGFIQGEMGVGKTIMAMCAVHNHARGKPYRAMVLCPDHLIGKWVEEIEDTIAGVTVRRVDNWKGVIDLIEVATPTVRKTRGSQVSVHKRRAKPSGATWLVLGRNQVKFYPGWLSVADKYRGFSGSETAPNSRHTICLGKEPVVDIRGQAVYGQHGQQLMTNSYEPVYRCPKCGTVVTGKKGLCASAADIAKTQMTCGAFMLRCVPDPKQAVEFHGPDLLVMPEGMRLDVVRTKVGQIVPHKGQRWRVERCGEPLWCYTGKPYRWPPARIIHKKLSRMFDYLVVDEVHEQKSDESARSMAAGKLMASVKHVIALTGTLIGGYADHLFPLLMRMCPKAMKDEGFEWGKSMEFSQQYGRVDRIVTATQKGDVEVSRRSRSMRRARTNVNTNERQEVRPGIMPSMFGRHLIGCSLYVRLNELSDDLPPLDVYVEEGAVDMLPGQAMEYNRIAGVLEAANDRLLQTGCRKLLGATLHTLLAYPDMPFKEEWEPEHPGFPSVGFYQLPKIYTPENWVGLCQPEGLPRETVYPKEQKLIDICKAENLEGRQTWVYVQMTGKRNVQPRLKRLLEEQGLRVGILAAGTCKPVDRLEWIAKNGSSYDVMISHPLLVSLGLELFAKEGRGTHNYSTIVFYQTGYDLFTLRQAERRSWRIGQQLDCKVYYLYYKGTMQHRAIDIMAKKHEASTNLEGDFSAEGLAAMAGEGSAQMAMAKALSQKLDDDDIKRRWGRLSFGKRREEAAPAEPAEPVKPNLRLVGQLALPAPEPPVQPSVPGDALPWPPSGNDDEDDDDDDMSIESLQAMFDRLTAAGMSLSGLEE